MTHPLTTVARENGLTLIRSFGYSLPSFIRSLIKDLNVDELTVSCTKDSWPLSRNHCCTASLLADGTVQLISLATCKRPTPVIFIVSTPNSSITSGITEIDKKSYFFCNRVFSLPCQSRSIFRLRNAAASSCKLND